MDRGLCWSFIHSVATLLAGLPKSSVGKLQTVQNCAARLVVRAPPHVHATPRLRHFHWLPVRARISCKTACFCFNAITSSTPAYLSDLLHTVLLDLFIPVPTSASSKFHSVSARRKVIVLPLTVAFLSGTHRRFTVEMQQLSTQSSLL